MVLWAPSGLAPVTPSHTTCQRAATRARPSTRRFATGYYGYNNGSDVPVAPSDEPAGVPAVSLVVPITCAVLVLLMAVLYELRKHIEHRNLFGKVSAARVRAARGSQSWDVCSAGSVRELHPRPASGLGADERGPGHRVWLPVAPQYARRWWLPARTRRPPSL